MREAFFVEQPKPQIPEPENGTFFDRFATEAHKTQIEMPTAEQPTAVDTILESTFVGVPKNGPRLREAVAEPAEQIPNKEQAQATLEQAQLVVNALKRDPEYRALDLPVAENKIEMVQKAIDGDLKNVNIQAEIEGLQYFLKQHENTLALYDKFVTAETLAAPDIAEQETASMSEREKADVKLRRPFTPITQSYANMNRARILAASKKTEQPVERLETKLETPVFDDETLNKVDELFEKMMGNGGSGDGGKKPEKKEQKKAEYPEYETSPQKPEATEDSFVKNEHISDFKNNINKALYDAIHFTKKVDGEDRGYCLLESSYKLGEKNEYVQIQEVLNKDLEFLKAGIKENSLLINAQDLNILLSEKNTTTENINNLFTQLTTGIETGNLFDTYSDEYKEHLHNDITSVAKEIRRIFALYPHKSLAQIDADEQALMSTPEFQQKILVDADEEYTPKKGQEVVRVKNLEKLSAVEAQITARENNFANLTNAFAYLKERLDEQAIQHDKELIQGLQLVQLNDEQQLKYQQAVDIINEKAIAENPHLYQTADKLIALRNARKILETITQEVQEQKVESDLELTEVDKRKVNQELQELLAPFRFTEPSPEELEAIKVKLEKDILEPKKKVVQKRKSNLKIKSRSDLETIAESKKEAPQKTEKEQWFEDNEEVINKFFNEHKNLLNYFNTLLSEGINEVQYFSQKVSIQDFPKIITKSIDILENPEKTSVEGLSKLLNWVDNLLKMYPDFEDPSARKNLKESLKPASKYGSDSVELKIPASVNREEQSSRRQPPITLAEKFQRDNKQNA